GDVPLIISVPQNKDEYFVKQSLAKEVWEQAKADFKAASETLPIAYSSEFTGRATQGAALAYLGKACLYTNDWEGVITALTPLTKSPYTYKLVDNFGDNFVIATENNEESIFEVQFKDIPGASFPNGFSARMVAPAEAQGWYELFPTNKLFDAFQKEKTVDGELDPRMYATLVWKYEGAMFYNRPFESLVLPFPQFKSWLKKYQNYDRDTESIGLAGSLNMMDNNERIMRYDYVLMMLAEAHTMKNQLSEAHTYLKQIRTRAKLDENKTASYNREQMMAEIQHQSMLEFARENQRFYDLRRWGILKQELLNSDKEGKEFYVEGKHDFFPIPQSEINANPAIEQNPYW
ncbi:MAG: RagB/SusD family nutrient uptake outer membrane protein, partial [Tannerellaceae bacterium]|nr:RagB/SusD family nutrient uptake outer membrane protein [Tannerellaceae bacterium]